MTTTKTTKKLTQREIAEQAINILGGVIKIARVEQLTQGCYISDDINEKLKEEGAICGGHKACFVGSLYLSGGIRPKFDNIANTWTIPGVAGGYTRIRYLTRYPALKLAYETANDAALRYAKKNFPKRFAEYIADYGKTPWSGWGETLFEEILPTASDALSYQEEINIRREIRDHVIKVMKNAQRQIRRQQLA